MESSSLTAEEALAMAAATPLPPPSTSHPRRPRVREVSSRFMSPVTTSSSSASSSGDPHLLPTKSPRQQPQTQQHRSVSVQRRRNQEHHDAAAAGGGDENRSDNIARSWDTPLGLQCKSVLPTAQRNKRAVKLFKEGGAKGGGGGGGGGEQVHHPDSTAAQRPKTAAASSKLLRPSTPQPLSPAASKPLLQSSGMSLSSSQASSDNAAAEDSDSSSSCATSPAQICKGSSRSFPPCRSSLPERNYSNRAAGNGGNVTMSAADFLKISSSPCSRSLNLALMGCDQSPSIYSSSLRAGEKPPPSVLPKTTLSNSLKTSGSGGSGGGGFILPPLPPYPKQLGADAKKGGKKATSQEDVHLLRLLQNHCLQWRFANAKAEAFVRSQIRDTKRSLYSLCVKLSELCDSVKSKRLELAHLQKTKALSAVLEAQVPYLEEWSALEDDDYLSSVSGVIQALTNASLQLPISGILRVDFKDVGEALNAATKMMDLLIFHLQSCLPKTMEIDSLMSELARVTGSERAFVEECDSLLSKAYNLQVEECNLRVQLIQFQQFSSSQPTEEF